MTSVNATEKNVESVSSILLPLVEARVRCFGSFHADTANAVIWPTETLKQCPMCTGTGYVPDPRFEALRTGDYVDTLHHFRGIDASLGAIVRAAAACGWAMELVPPEKNWPDFLLWKGSLVSSYEGLPSHPHLFAYSRPIYAGRDRGHNPEEAAARALVAAVGDDGRLTVT